MLIGRKTSNFQYEKIVDWILTLRGAGTIAGISIMTGLLGRGVYLRANNAFYKSLITRSKAETDSVWPYFPRVGIFPLLSAEKAVILTGPHRSGKSVYLAHAIMKQAYPWWRRFIFPPKGFFLQGDQSAPSAREWFSIELNSGGKEDPIKSIVQIMLDFSEKQRVRRFLFDVLPFQLPRFLRKQPTLIIIDQAEELINHHRADFINIVFPLVKLCKGSPDVVQLVFVVNSPEAVASLEALNGGNLFDVVECPKPNVDRIAATYGEDFLVAHKEMDECIGITQDYFRTRQPNETPNQFKDRYLTSYNQVHGVKKAVTKTELELYLDPLAKARDTDSRT